MHTPPRRRPAFAAALVTTLTAASMVIAAAGPAASAPPVPEAPGFPQYHDLPAPALPEGSSISVFDTVEIPADTPVDGAAFGGISGLDKVGTTDEYVAISNSSDLVRYYRLSIGVDGDQLVVDPEITATNLLTPDGAPFAAGTADPSAIRVMADGQSVAWTDNGPNKRDAVNPQIHESALDGTYRTDHPVPEPYLPVRYAAPRPYIGVVSGQGIESLGVVPSSGDLRLTPEGHLDQDYFLYRGYVFLDQYRRMNDVSNQEKAEQFGYLYELADNTTVTEILPISPTSTLVLTLPPAETNGNPTYETTPHLRLFSSEGVDEAAADPEVTVPVRATSLDLGVPAEAFDGTEGSLSWGPTLDDGSRLLLLASDAEDGAATRITALRVVGGLDAYDADQLAANPGGPGGPSVPGEPGQPGEPAEPEPTAEPGEPSQPPSGEPSAPAEPEPSPSASAPGTDQPSTDKPDKPDKPGKPGKKGKGHDHGKGRGNGHDHGRGHGKGHDHGGGPRDHGDGRGHHHRTQATGLQAVVD